MAKTLPVFSLCVTSLIFGCGDPSTTGDCDIEREGDAARETDADGDSTGDAGAQADSGGDAQADSGGDAQADSGGDADDEACAPLMCDELPGLFGEVDDGCGGRLSCPSCPQPLTSSATGGCECLAPDCELLCDGELFEEFDSTPFVLGSGTSGVVIQGCTFRDGTASAVQIRGASRVLIQDCRFESLRSARVGVDLHAINIPEEGNQITIQRSTFVDISADGVQMGHASGPDGEIVPRGNPIEHIFILENEFILTDGVAGENGVDVKTTTGPIEVAGNSFHGFHPCESGSEGCSGSAGEAIVIHRGATGVTVARNLFWDNTIGVSVTEGSRQVPPVEISVINNVFFDHQNRGLAVFRVHSIEVFHNTFLDPSGTLFSIRHTPAGGGTCSNANNLFVGEGEASDECGGEGNLTLSGDEAAFVDAEAFDLHITSGSLAVDQGIELETLTWDLDGQQRPAGAASDVGADEHH